MIRRRKYLAAMFAALSGTAVSFAANSGGQTVDVQPAGELGGEFADVRALSGTFTVQRGQAQVIGGVELFEIELGDKDWSDEAAIDVFLMNPKDLGKVLGNPNSYIEVAAWYRDDGGESTITDSNGTDRDVSRDNDAVARMTGSSGAAKLIPSVNNEKYLYLLARITVPGGAPSGQQGKSDLQFNINVRRT